MLKLNKMILFYCYIDKMKDKDCMNRCSKVFNKIEYVKVYVKVFYKIRLVKIILL